jgi:hypothetical protein
MALAHTAQHTIWICILVTKLGLTLHFLTLTQANNQAMIDHASNAMTTACFKHIDLHHHFIWETIMTVGIKLNYCDMADNAAELFTKPLTAPMHWRLV